MRRSSLLALLLFQIASLTAGEARWPAPVPVQGGPVAEVCGELRWARKLDRLDCYGRPEGLIQLAGERYRLQAWQGDDAAGGRAWSGVVLWSAAPRSVALIDYAIHEGPRRRQRDRQDAHLRLVALATAPDALPLVHGECLRMDRPLPAAALVCDLSVRHPGWNGRHWDERAFTVGDVSVASGVWQVPAGLTFHEAQRDRRNRLSDLGLLRWLRPVDDPIAVDFRVADGGRWRVLLDVGRDGVVDLVWGDGLAGARASDLEGIDGRSGLLLCVDSAGGNRPGSAGLSEFEIALAPPLDPDDLGGPRHPRAIEAVAMPERLAAEARRGAEQRAEREAERERLAAEREAERQRLAARKAAREPPDQPPEERDPPPGDGFGATGF